MAVKRVEQAALTTFFVGACAAIAIAACAAVASAHADSPTLPQRQSAVLYLLAQSSSGSLTLPQAPAIPVSPTTPGSGLSVSTNPITGLPCSGEGSTALATGMPNGNDEDEGATSSTTPGGFSPSSSVFGASNGAC